MGRPRTPPELVEAMLERRKQKKREYDAENSQRNKLVAELLHDAGGVSAPESVLAERDRRLAAPRTWEMENLGDPKFGQSMAEKMRMA